MKINAGKFKKTTLYSIKGLQIRPTSDKIREALFDIIGNLVSEAALLDLFAGTGAMGLEALSRGAKKVVFVENAPGCIRIIDQNCKKCRVYEQARIIAADVFAALDKLKKNREKFDIVFADPPYRFENYDKLVKEIVESDILNPNPLIVVEHHRRTVLNPPGGWVIEDSRRYGDTCLSFIVMTN